MGNMRGSRGTLSFTLGRIHDWTKLPKENLVEGKEYQTNTALKIAIYEETTETKGTRWKGKL